MPAIITSDRAKWTTGRALTKTDGRPNILWIQSDELRADAIGCYGNGLWRPNETPNIDQLAADGVRFSQTLCNSPVCVPSRASLLSGQYPHELGIYHNDPVKDPANKLGDDVITFPETLAQHGYRTVTLGKHHVPTHPVWGETTSAPDRPDGGYLGVAATMADDEVIRIPGPPHLVIGGTYPEVPDIGTPTTELTELAIARLRLFAPEDAWLMRVSYLMPHTPVLPPQRFLDRYDPSEFAYDPDGDVPCADGPPLELFLAAVQGSTGIKATDVARARASYFATVEHLDDEVGRLLDALHRLGLSDDTIVVLDSDHGVLLGEMAVWQKQNFNIAAHRVPQIVAWPGELPGGTVRDDLNELVDRGPTLLGLCGLEPQGPQSGRDLFGGSDEPESSFGIIGYGLDDSIVYPLMGSGSLAPQRACVRTKRYRYERSTMLGGHEIPSGHEIAQVALIDTETDPNERVNVAGNPVYRKEQNQLETIMTERLAQALPRPK